jgi:hypothetical protein
MTQKQKKEHADLIARNEAVIARNEANDCYNFLRSLFEISFLHPLCKKQVGLSRIAEGDTECTENLN